MRKRSPIRGFTLIEIVIVVALIAILSLGATLAYNTFTDKARQATSATAAKSVQDAINIQAAKAGVAAGAIVYDSGNTGTTSPTTVPFVVGDYTVVQAPYTSSGANFVYWLVYKPTAVAGSGEYLCSTSFRQTETLAPVFGCNRQ